METFTYFNIIALSVFTWYTLDANTDQSAVTNISVGITFVQLLLVISYHVYKYTNHKLFLRIQEIQTGLSKEVDKKLKAVKKDRRYHQPKPTDNDINQHHELLEMADRPANTKSNKPTQSVVELPKPHSVVVPQTFLESMKKEKEPSSQRNEGDIINVTVAERIQAAHGDKNDSEKYDSDRQREFGEDLSQSVTISQL